MILDYKNSSIYYEDEGHGEVVVLLHGFLEDASMWKDLKPEFLKSKRVVCIDLLGHGQTDCIGYIHTMSDMANAVLAVLKYLDIRTFKLIGHSMGGYVALALSEMEPEAILALCLMNSTYKADDEERKALRKRANQMIQTNFEAMVRMSFTNLFSEESRMAHQGELEMALQNALETPIQGYIAAQEGMLMRKDKFEFLKSLNTKKLIVIGEKDPVVDGDALVKETEETDIETAVFSQGHMSHIENKKEITYKLLRFIE